MKKNELNEVKAFARFMAMQYPEVIWRFDYAAGARLTIGQARQNQLCQMTSRGYPDIFIAEARGGYCGLFIELKATGQGIYLKDGKTLRKGPHIAEQHAMLNKLRSRGYYATFCEGWENAVKVVSQYMNEGWTFENN